MPRPLKVSLPFKFYEENFACVFPFYNICDIFLTNIIRLDFITVILFYAAAHCKMSVVCRQML